LAAWLARGVISRMATFDLRVAKLCFTPVPRPEVGVAAATCALDLEQMHTERYDSMLAPSSSRCCKSVSCHAVCDSGGVNRRLETQRKFVYDQFARTQLNFFGEDAVVYAMDIESINPTFARMLAPPQVPSWSHVNLTQTQTQTGMALPGLCCPACAQPVRSRPPDLHKPCFLGLTSAQRIKCTFV
jgi:hypothetical protein